VLLSSSQQRLLLVSSQLVIGTCLQGEGVQTQQQKKQRGGLAQ
jgi:hypothetical protein